jgi:hypothetical protein
LVVLDVVHLPVPRSLDIAEPVVELLTVVDRGGQGEEGGVGEQKQVFPNLTTLRAKRLNFIENQVLKKKLVSQFSYNLHSERFS